MKIEVRHSHAEERGASIIELALTLPFLLVLFFGMIQWSQIAGGYITLRQAAAVGARMKILDGMTNAAAATAAQNAVAPSLDPAQATATVGPHASVAGAWQVTLNYNFPLVFKFVVPGQVNGYLPLQASMTAK